MEVNQCYWLIFEAFKIIFPTVPLIFTATKLFIMWYQREWKWRFVSIMAVKIKKLQLKYNHVVLKLLLTYCKCIEDCSLHEGNKGQNVNKRNSKNLALHLTWKHSILGKLNLNIPQLHTIKLFLYCQKMLCLEENSQPLEQFWKKVKFPMNWTNSGNELSILVNHIHVCPFYEDYDNTGINWTPKSTTRRFFRNRSVVEANPILTSQLTLPWKLTNKCLT